MREHFAEELLLYKHNLHQKFEQDISDEVRKLRERHEGNEKKNQTKMQIMEKEYEDNVRKKFESRERSLLSRIKKMIYAKKKDDEEVKRAKEKEADIERTKRIYRQNQVNLRENLLEKMKRDFDGRKIEMKKEFEKQKEKDINRILRSKTKELKRKLNSDFEKKLKIELKKKEIEFERKKVIFEDEIKKKARVLFN